MTPSIAPATPMTVIDELAHQAASYVRPRRKAADNRAAQVIGFRIMKETEITPGWWGQPVEVGETGSGAVAHQFCMDQNKVTMQLNRPKMIQFFAEPVYAEPMASADSDWLASDQVEFDQLTAGNLR